MHGDRTGVFADSDLRRFRRMALSWYDQNRRDLPWRRTRDAYAIWVSEIMLQQTRVAAVLEHYRVFLDRFPNVATLAAASEDDVLAAWSGLGYYRRARMMHRCAGEILARHGGRFPERAAAWRELPGIGRYTAAAIASIAFGEASAVVDGNVERVLQRIGGRSLRAAESWARAEELLSRSRPGDFNQAMMELGATVCLPGEPRCAVCPVRSLCATGIRELRAEGSERSALRTKAVPRQKREIWCWLERRNGSVRLVQRAQKAPLMAGMWELPQFGEVPGEAASVGKWRTFRHSITVTDYTVHVLRAFETRMRAIPKNGAPDRSGPARRGKWVAIGEISRLPITGLTRKILKADGII